VAELVGLTVAVMFVVLVLMPILTFLRMGRLSRELDELRERVRTLEALTVRPARESSAAASSDSAAARQSFAGEAVGNARPDPTARAGVAPQVSAGTHPLPYQSAALPGIPADERQAYSEPWRDKPRQPTETDLPQEDLEGRIGGRGLLYVGILVLLFGVSFFLKYAFDNAWVNETGRVVLGALGGIGLIVAGLRLAATGLAVFGQALAGAGFAVLYLATYAALNFYALIGENLAFAFMVIITIAAAAVADRQRAQALAVIAVGGGFLTPFLVGGGENAQLTLFTYDAVLVAGTLFLAIRHHWMGLNALSYGLTVITLLAWAATHYTADQWLRTLLFLTLFCVLFLIILRETRRAGGRLPSGKGEARHDLAEEPWRVKADITAQLVAVLLATAPILYHIAAVVITAAHPPAIHVYLIASTCAGLWLTAEPHRPWVRLLVLLAGLVPLFGTLTLPDGLTWMMPNVVTIVAIAALHLMAILDRIVRQNETLDIPDLLALHLTGLGLFALLYESLNAAYPEIRGLLAAIIAFGAFGLWQWLPARDRVASLNAAALAFTLGAIAVAVQFDGPVVVIGWAAQGAAAAWVGLRAPSLPFQYGGLLLWGMAALRLSDGYFETPANFTAIVNERSIATVFIVALAYAMATMFRRWAPVESERTRLALHVLASVLTLMWITAEIRSFWEVRYESSQAYLYEQMLLSLAWGLYGAVLIVIGLWRSYPPGRYIGITVIAVTALKVFFYDLWELGGIYRVVGFIGFGALLVLVSYLYQQRRAVRPPSATAQPLSDDATS
jgi:uncharacterized membrane protein